MGSRALSGGILDRDARKITGGSENLIMGNDKQPRITVSITKQELAQLPIANFIGSVKVIDKLEDAAAAVAELREADVIGFDTETRPSFRKGVINKVSLMQLSTRKCCYLFRLNKIGTPDVLRELLEDETKLKVGLSIHDDFHNMRNLSPIEPRGFIDLQPYVKQFSIADNSLARIYGILFGQRISKGQRLTNWEADELTINQQHYAALDAIACIQIYDYVTKGGFHPESSPYMHPELETERIDRERREERERRLSEATEETPNTTKDISKEIEQEDKTKKKTRRRNARKRRKSAEKRGEAASTGSGGPTGDE